MKWVKKTSFNPDGFDARIERPLKLDYECGRLTFWFEDNEELPEKHYYICEYEDGECLPEYDMCYLDTKFDDRETAFHYYLVCVDDILEAGTEVKLI